MRRNAVSGDWLAQNSPGYCYEDSLGVRRDQKQAVERYRKAAALGDGEALKALRRLGAKP